jgi:ComF family protein
VLDVVAPPLCACCGAHAGRSEPLCGECRRAMRWLGPAADCVGGVELWAPAAYDGPARALVSRLKFRGATRTAETMAAQVVARAPPGWLSDAILVPVPIHPARRRRRGFNQAGELAAALASRTGLGVSECLERGGRGTRQTGRSRAERARAIEGAVGVRPGALVPAGALLVDDVVTTGATLAACADALHRVGVRSIRAVAYARTPGR